MRLIAAIAVCLVYMTALPGTVLAADSLDVPYLSQFWKESPSNGNCAPAAMEMCAAYVQGRQPTVDNIIALNKLMGKANPIKGGPTKHREIMEAGKKLYNLPIEYKHMTLDEALKEVAAGGPVMAGIIYRHISNRWDQHCTGGHMLVIVGSDEKSVIVNDPDEKRDGKGKDMRYDRAEFAKAFEDFGNAVLVGFRKPPPSLHNVPDTRPAP